MITAETRQLSFEDIKVKKQIRYNQILDRLDKPKTAKEIAVELIITCYTGDGELQNQEYVYYIMPVE